MNSEVIENARQTYKALTTIRDEDLDWLELPNIPIKVPNPFYLNRTTNDPAEEIIRVALDPDYLYFTAKFILGIDLLPFQLSILEVLWKKRYPMFIGSRGCGKTFILAVYSLLRMVLEPGCKIVGVGSGLRQSRQIFDYMVRIWDKAPILQDITGKGKSQGPKREVDRFQFAIGDSIAIFCPIGSGEKIRGIRANYVLIDEFASVPEEIINVVVRGFAVVSQSPIDKVKNQYRKNRLKRQNLWSKEMESIEKESEQKNQIVYSGTAYYSFNHFYKYFIRWRKIIASKGNPKILDDIFGDDAELKKSFDWTDYAIIRIPYTAIPEGMMDPSIIADAKMNLTTAQFNCEYNAIFSVDSDGFYKRSILESASTHKPVLVNGKRIQFRCLRQGDKDKKYIIGIDPAADMDNAAVVILEINDDHRRIVNCWTTNRKKYNQLKKFYSTRGQEIEDDYYRYVAQKIKELMSLFRVEHIIMDKNGGGIAIAEALASRRGLIEGDYPIYEIIDPEKPKPNDEKEGLHILELISPTNDINSEANHGMLKDFQDKVLLFPMIDTIELARAALIDTQNEEEVETYEDLVNEIEELKNEITSIVVTPSASLGKETFDTPRAKTGNDRKGYLRKDRYSALLYANYYARSKGKKDIPAMQYRPVGAIKNKAKALAQDKSSQMYTGLGLVGIEDKSWLKGANYRVIRR